MANRLLMLGHSGLIGQAILSAPSRTEFILAKNRLDLKKLDSNVSIIREAEENNATGILNLAWESNSRDDYDKLKTHSNWLTATEHFARAAVNAGLKVYLVGTCQDDQPLISNEYASAKFQLKESLRDLIFSGDVIWFRPYYIISINHRRPRIIRGILELANKSFTIQSPNSTNDFICSEDVGSAIICSIENEVIGEIDIGSGVLTSNLKIAKTICKLKNLPMPAIGNQVKKQGKVANIKHLEESNWSPMYTKSFLKGEAHD